YASALAGQGRCAALILAQEERFYRCWLLQQRSGPLKRVVDGLFQAVEPKASPVRVHHQAERRGSARVARNRDGDGAIVLQQQKAASNGDLHWHQHGLPGAGSLIPHLAKIVGRERDTRATLIEPGTELRREPLEERAGQFPGLPYRFWVESFHATQHGYIMAGLGFQAELKYLRHDGLH